jgi:hypothetical protein
MQSNLRFTELLCGNDLSFISDSIQFQLRENVPGSGNGGVRIGKTVEMVARGTDEASLSNRTPETFALSLEACQKLVDQLYALGIRPSKIQHDSPVVLAQQAHIDDLRKVAFEILGRPILPER